MSDIREILIGPTRRWREDALKNLPYMPQKRYLEEFPLLCRIRRNINKFISTRRFFADVADVPIPTQSGKDISLEALISPIYRVREITTTLPIPHEIVVDRAY